MKRIAIIDIGSNSARLVIIHLLKSGAYNMVFTQKESLRLSQKVDSNNMLTEAGMDETISCMKSFAYMCQVYEVDTTIAVATAAIRNSSNGQELCDRIEKTCGIKLEIITGKTEAQMSYLGVANTLNVKDAIIFDLGGGSTEVILMRDRRISKSVSLPIGAVSATELYDTKNKFTPESCTALSEHLKSLIKANPWITKNKGLPLIGVGGTARTIAKIIQRSKNYSWTKIHGFSISRECLDSFWSSIRETDMTGRLDISGLSKDRNDLILAGAMIVTTLAEATDCSKLISSGCGLREGLFFDYLGRLNNKPVLMEDVLEESVINAVKLYCTDLPHTINITGFALKLFDSLKKLHGLDDSYRRYLKTAAMLHDSGITLNYYSHARHSAYIVQNAKLFGLSHKEQLFTSCIVGWHHGVAKNYFKGAPYNTVLTPEDWTAINKLALLLALAEALDATETRRISSIDPLIDGNQVILEITAPEMPTIELKALENHMKWFKKVYGKNLLFRMFLQNKKKK